MTHVGTVYPSTAPSSLVDAIQSASRGRELTPEAALHRAHRRATFREALLGLGDMVELYGYLPQREALAAMNETDYVLLLNTDPLNVGNKFYDYVGGGKPILGAVHPRRRDARSARSDAGRLVGRY